MSAKSSQPKDLIVLVADTQQEKTIATLLNTRCDSLRIHQPSFEIFPHPQRDPGVFTGAGNFLRVFVNQYRYALVIFDAAWDGSPATVDEMARKVQTDLDQSGWQNRNAVVVIDPELEIWVWSDSPHVPQVLGTDWNTIHALAEERGYWVTDAPKPHQPKQLLEDVLQETNKRRSAALFEQIAKQVGLERCRDASFTRLRQILQTWFSMD